MSRFRCGQTGMIGHKAGKVLALRFRCKSWKCDKCRPALQKRVMAIGAQGNPNRFITLTINPANFSDFDEAACALKDGMRRAFEALMRSHGHEKIEYLAVFEQHKSGWPHLHVLVRSRFIPQRWLVAYMKKRGLGKIVDIRKVRGKRNAALYVAKYMGKEPRRYNGCKRYWTSQKYAERRPKRERDPAITWIIDRHGKEYAASLGFDAVADFIGKGATAWVLDPVGHTRCSNAA